MLKPVLRGTLGAVEEAKRGLRRVIRARRRAWTGIEREAASRALVEHLLADPRWARAQMVGGFVSMYEEPETRAILAAALEGGKVLWLPRVMPLGRGEMQWFRLQDLAALETGPLGIAEPPAVGAPGDPRHFDVLLVPGVAFDRAGNRLGMGGGYYDRALASIAEQAEPWRVGVALSSFVDPREGAIPTASHDVGVHAIATELGIVRCGPVATGN